ncbi:MAG TPA: ParB/RepB/Spo0J family partition protein [Alphaproteobacteria bacterium]|nr:ParB/RepB/Spo0J family partition protein [Alphaproteobacteria bacterium]
MSDTDDKSRPAAREGKRRNLGRGLNALLGGDADSDIEDRGRGPRMAPVESIEPSRVQPRRIFDKADLDSLTQSIREKGILQPILVRPMEGGSAKYELVAGERRWLAAQAARLHEVPIIVRELDDASALEIAIIENIQRSDLTPLEEAEGYRRLMDEFKHTQDALSKVVGKSRSHVANTLRLMSLPPAVKEMIDKREITAGHARTLVNAKDPEALARDIVSKGLTVRDAERMTKGDKKTKSKKDRGKSADALALESDLSSLLGLGVAINTKGESGSMVIHFKSLEQLDDLIQRLSRGSL